MSKIKEDIALFIAALCECESRDIMVSRKYIVEKLTRIISGTMEFHHIVEQHRKNVAGKEKEYAEKLYGGLK